MGDVVGIGGKIVNPMAQTVLTLSVDDANNVKLQSQLPPNMTIKILQGIITDIIVGMIEDAKTPQEPKSPIVV